MYDHGFFGHISRHGLNRHAAGVEASLSPLPQPSVYSALFSLFAVVTADHDGRRGDLLGTGARSRDVSCSAEAARLPLSGLPFRA